MTPTLATAVLGVLVAGYAGQPVPDAPSSSVPSARHDSAANSPGENEITPELEKAWRSGLAALAREQRDDGSFGDGAFGSNVAITSLACLAFMGDGHVPGRGIYGENVAKGLEFILSNSQENGLVATPSANVPMYGHGFATVFLGEIYGMTRGGPDAALSQRVHTALVKAVRLLETTQNPEGGWRYNPVPFEADVSVTICAVMGLRAARNAGLEVSKDVIDKAVDYVRVCQNDDGGFRYMKQVGASAWPRSAAGVATLYYAGIYEDRAIESGLEYLETNASNASFSMGQMHYFYGQYYGVQAMFLAGGKHWSQWWPKVREELLRRQGTDGLWDDPSVGKPYGTAMALIILQMPKRYLPIFQK